jgi:hypothetical protein
LVLSRSFVALKFHPASLLLTWMAMALALQWLTGEALVVVALGFLFLALVVARSGFLKILRRLRWLIVAVTVIFAFITPGEYLEGVGGSLGLTREGVIAALEHLLRLVALVASLAITLFLLPLPQLIGALRTLTYPAMLLGMRRDRAALRLMLVLHYIDGDERRSWRSWLLDVTDVGPDVVAVEVSEPGPFDYLWWLCLLVALAVLGYVS